MYLSYKNSPKKLSGGCLRAWNNDQCTGDVRPKLNIGQANPWIAGHVRSFILIAYIWEAPIFFSLVCLQMKININWYTWTLGPERKIWNVVPNVNSWTTWKGFKFPWNAREWLLPFLGKNSMEQTILPKNKLIVFKDNFTSSDKFW